MSGPRPDESNTAKEPAVNHLKGSDVSAVWRQPDGETLPYRCRAQWTVLRDGEKPVAEMFYTSYVQENVGDRPISRPGIRSLIARGLSGRIAFRDEMKRFYLKASAD